MYWHPLMQCVLLDSQVHVMLGVSPALLNCVGGSISIYSGTRCGVKLNIHLYGWNGALMCTAPVANLLPSSPSVWPWPLESNQGLL